MAQGTVLPTAEMLPCRCGCGQESPVSRTARDGRRVGGPTYLRGHAHRLAIDWAERKCTRCKLVKPRSEFGPERRQPTGMSPRCRQCAREKAREYWSRVGADKWRLRDYGLTPDAYDALVKRAAGRCEVCGALEPLVIDHNHTTGVVRGLICDHCNVGIGRLGDTAEALRRALAYLERTEDASSIV